MKLVINEKQDIDTCTVEINIFSSNFMVKYNKLSK